MTPFDQLRITQLISTYAPDQPPRLPLDFSDYLSLLWRLDRAAEQRKHLQYYRKCEQVLAAALEIGDTDFGRLVRVTAPGQIYETLPQLPYRTADRRMDAADRRAAIQQLLNMRSDIVRLGTYDQEWHARWPGGGLIDNELRERVFAILFAALPSQYPPFSRLLLVVDIVLQELLIGTRRGDNILLHLLVTRYGYPDPDSRDTTELFGMDPVDG